MKRAFRELSRGSVAPGAIFRYSDRELRALEDGPNAILVRAVEVGPPVGNDLLVKGMQWFVEFETAKVGEQIALFEIGPTGRARSIFVKPVDDTFCADVDRFLDEGY